jgi:leucyl aminopeptidase
MQIDVRHGSIYEGSAVIAVGMFEGEEVQKSQAGLLDNALKGLISDMVASGEFEGKAGQTVVLYPGEEFAAQRAVLVGLGKRDKFNADALRKAAAHAARTVRDLRRTKFDFLVPGAVDSLTAEMMGAAIAEGAVLSLYRFLRYKTDEETKKQQAVDVERLTLVTGKADDVDELQRGATFGQVVAEASCHARDLANLPSNELTPVRLAEEAQRLAQEVGLRCEIWDENEMRQRGMGALLGVAQGSANPPRFIILEHQGNDESAPPMAFVGKGVTFDSGGISLKPGEGMDAMKMDMSGAGAVIATMGAVARLKLPQRVLGVVAAVENMPSGTAQKPGDIVQACNGKTIEVLNTDAEGRLILADALAFVSGQKPQAIVDLATLTGAVVTALGNECAGMMGNNTSLMDKIRAAAEASGDKVWELPLWDEYQEHVKGQLADVKNIGKNRAAGAIAGAAFLSHFVGEGIPWAHLDIAGTAWGDETPLNVKGPTGWGVRLLVYLLKAWE